MIASVSLRTGQSLRRGLGPSNYLSRGLELYLSPKDVRRWEHAAKAIKGKTFWKGRLIDNAEREYKNIKNSLCASVPNITFGWDSSEPFDWKRNADHALSSLAEQPALLWGGMILPFVYGGIHLTAWKFSFPSVIEAILWIGSSIGIMGTISWDVPSLFLVSQESC